MTANALLDNLGPALCTAGVPSSNPLSYSTATGQITASWGNPYNFGAAQLMIVRDTFNALSTVSRPISNYIAVLVDTLGLALCVNGVPTTNPCSYAGGQISITWGNPFNLTQAMIAAVMSAFNALSSALLQLPNPAPQPSPMFVRGLLVGGESIMANCGGAASNPTFYTIAHPGRQWNINPQNGVLTPMAVPMPGVSYVCDSFIPQLADVILSSLPLEHIVVGNIAITGMTFGDYAVGGQHNGMIKQMLDYFSGQRIVPSAVIWGMGINDSSRQTPSSEVQSKAQSVVDAFRFNGYVGPIIFSIETIASNSPPSVPVTAGLQAAVALSANTFIGPNLDVLLTSGDKYDGTHPNYVGETKLAAAWAAAVAPYIAK